MTIKQFPGKPKGGQFQSLLFSLILQPVRINKPGAPLLGLAKSLYYRQRQLWSVFFRTWSQNGIQTLADVVNTEKTGLISFVKFINNS